MFGKNKTQSSYLNNENAILANLRMKYVLSMTLLCASIIIAIFSGIALNSSANRTQSLEKILYASLMTPTSSFVVDNDEALGYLALPWYNQEREQNPFIEDKTNSVPQNQSKKERQNAEDANTGSNQASDYISVSVYEYDTSSNKLVPVSEQYAIPSSKLSKISKEVAGSPWGLTRSKNTDMYFYKSDTQYGIRVAFTPTSYVDDYMSTIINSFVFAAVIAVMAIIVISFLLSNWFLVPVRKAWHEQKRFISDASHELRTPISVIMSNMEVMKKLHQSDKDIRLDDVYKWVDTSLAETYEMTDLVNDMLFLASTNESRRALENEEVNFSKLVKKTSLSLDGVALENSQEIENDIEKDCYVSGSPKALQRIVSVLMDNALKYADKNTVITVSLKRSGKNVVLKINDHGVVIPKEDLKAVFDRFYRGDQSRERHSGYGLGLSMAYELVKMHSGDIKAESSKDEGTTFVVTLPEIKKRPSN